jgi:hypothetical protein
MFSQNTSVKAKSEEIQKNRFAGLLISQTHCHKKHALFLATIKSGFQAPFSPDAAPVL